MILDLIVLVVILASCIIAFLRGFIREVLTIVGLIGGTAAAVAIGPSLTPLMAHLLHVDPKVPHKYFGVLPAPVLAEGLAYGVIFIVVVLALSVLSHLMSGWARAIGLGPLNRTFGVLFGVARAFLLVGLFYLPIYQFTTAQDRDTWGWLQNSHTRLYVEAVSARLMAMMPEGLIDKTAEKAQAATGASMGGTVNDTRTKLEQLDLIRRGVPVADPSQPPPFPVIPKDDQNGQGYGKDQRQDMNTLINNQGSDSNAQH